MEQILGDLPGYNGTSDSVQEALDLRAWGDLKAVGIGISEGTTADSRLDLIDTPGGSDAANVTNPIDLTGAIIDAISEVDTSLASVGDDTIIGGEGDDLIFGDALFTDTLATDAGLSTDSGAGWEVFEGLEAGDAVSGSYTFDDGTSVDYADWTRTDTINYILENEAELAQESTIG